VFFENLLPQGVSTKDGLIEIVMRKTGTTVVVKLRHIAKYSTRADLHYELKFIATTLRGKRFVYAEQLFARFRPSMILSLAAQMVKSLEESLPDVHVSLLLP